MYKALFRIYILIYKFYLNYKYNIIIYNMIYYRKNYIIKWIIFYSNKYNRFQYAIY